MSFFLQDGSEDPPGPVMQKTPIILAKPPSDRVNLYTPCHCLLLNLCYVARDR